MAISLFSLKKSPTQKVTSFIDPTKFGGAASGGRKRLQSEVVEAKIANKEVKELGYIRRALETLVSIEKRHYDLVTDSIKQFVLSEEKRQAREEESMQESSKDKEKNKKEEKNPLVREGKKRLEGFGEFLQGLMKMFIGYKILEWASKPENGKKIQNIINFFGRLFKFIGVIGKGIAIAFGATPIGIVLNNLPKAFDLVVKVIGGIVDFLTFKWMGESIQNVGKLIGDSINVLKIIPESIGKVIDFVTNLIPNFIENVLTEGLFGSQKQLQQELDQSEKTGTATSGSDTGGAPNQQTPQIDFGKVLGDSIKGVASKVLENVIPGGKFISDVGKGISGLFGGDKDLPKLAKGGIVTKPTEAIVGEAGPEAILPLDKLGSFGIADFKGKVDKQIPKFIKLLTLPFKIIGAGIVALISSSVSNIPGLGPVLMPLISNVASMFGIPPSLVKGMSNFAAAAVSTVGKGISGAAEIFGAKEPKIQKTDEFKPSGDTSVRGLLGDILTALISKNSSDTKPTQTPSAPPAGASPAPSAAPTSGAPAMPPNASMAKPGEASVQNLEGTVSDLQKKGFKYVNNTANRFFQDEQGRLYEAARTGSTLAGADKFKLKAVTQEQIDKGFTAAGSERTTGSRNNQEIQRQLEMFRIINEGGTLRKQTTGSETQVKQDGKWQNKATGGNIHGFGDGDKYPALLEAGEYVLNKNAVKGVGGQKFLDKINFDMFPRFGNDISRLYDNDKVVTRTYANGGIIAAAKQAVSQGKRGPASPPCASWVRMVLGMAGSPAANKVTAKGDLDPEKKTWGPNMAASFAGSDMGEIIGSQGNLQPGDVVLHRNTYGNYPAGAVTHVSIASEKKGKIYHQPTSGAPPTEGSIWNFKAGIRLGGSGGTLPTSTTSGGGGGDSSSTPDWSSIGTELGNLFKTMNTPVQAEPQEPPKITASVPATSQRLQSAQKENVKIEAEKRVAGKKSTGNVVTIGDPNRTITESNTKAITQPLGGTTPPIPLSVYPVNP
jgi:hypothetical protein